MKAAGETLPPLVRAKFIALRTALFQRGVYDPILARFDTFTVSKASSADAAQQLLALAAATRL